MRAFTQLSMAVVAKRSASLPPWWLMFLPQLRSLGNHISFGSWVSNKTTEIEASPRLHTDP
jgi:hypothetical protein